MDQHWREALEGLKESTDGLLEAHTANNTALEALTVANQAFGRAGAGIQKAIDALMAAHDEHEDLRDTVARLEGLVIELVERGRKNGGA